MRKQLTLLAILCILPLSFMGCSERVAYPPELEEVYKMCDSNGGVKWVTIGFDDIDVTCYNGMMGTYNRLPILGRADNWVKVE